jgi:hypothetical protein
VFVDVNRGSRFQCSYAHIAEDAHSAAASGSDVCHSSSSSFDRVGYERRATHRRRTRASGLVQTLLLVGVTFKGADALGRPVLAVASVAVAAKPRVPTVCVAAVLMAETG